MPPSPRPLPMYAAEPAQEAAPYGRWADVLRAQFLAGVAEIDADEEIGEPGDLTWFPDRTWGGRTYLPATCPTSEGFELFGYVSFRRAGDDSQPEAYEASVEYTDVTAAAHPDWSLDLSDQEIGSWRGVENRRGVVTLVWGVALVRGGAVATAELGPSTTDQCVLAEDRFTLVSLDAFTGDFVEVRLYDRRGSQLAAESLYEEE